MNTVASVEGGEASGARAGMRSAGAAQLRSATLAVIALTVLAAALRFGTLGVQSIWLDESATMLLVRQGFSGMLSHLSASESSPPLYYVLVWAWTKLFGVGPLGFRSFSALVGTVTVPVMYLAGRTVSRRVGLWAALLAAVNPAMYYYSQEARCYALLILFSAAAIVMWQRALRQPGARSLALWALMSILAVLTHYFAAFLFIPETIVLARRLGWRRVLAPAGAVAAVSVALLPLALHQHANSKKTEWIESTSLPSRVAETAKQFFVGLYGPVEVLTAALCGLLALAALALVLRRAHRSERLVARDLLVVAATALALPLLAAASHTIDVFDGRNLIEVWVPVALLLAVGLGCARAGRSGTLLGVGLCAISLAVIAATDLIPGYQRDNWRGAAHALPAVAAGGRLIVTEENGSAPLGIYLSSLRTLTAANASTREVDFVVLRERRTGRSPRAPQAPTSAPAGFRLASVRDSESYAVSTFISPSPQTVTVKAIRRLTATNAEVASQP